MMIMVMIMMLLLFGGDGGSNDDNDNDNDLYDDLDNASMIMKVMIKIKQERNKFK